MKSRKRSDGSDPESRFIVDGIAERFSNEKLGLHWQVNETKESFGRLLYHLEVRSNFRPYFDEAIRCLDLGNKGSAGGLVIADIGAGVCWTSALLAKRPDVRYVYAVDPSDNRLAHAKYVIEHFGVTNKVTVIHGTFLDPHVPEKVDIVVLCGSLHHCYDSQMKGLFTNIRRMLKPGGRVLVANEHYVSPVWFLKRIASYMKVFYRPSELYYFPLKKLRSPHPRDGEHWRTRGELERIFEENGFKASFFLHRGDLCKDKNNWYQELGWHFYHAILTPALHA